MLFLTLKDRINARTIALGRSQKRLFAGKQQGTGRLATENANYEVLESNSAFILT